jgi:hypothetical protein
MSGRMITVHDIYSLTERGRRLGEFPADGRNFRQPEGLGFDNSPVAQWRAMIRPAKYL